MSSPCLLAGGLRIPLGDSRVPLYTCTRASPCPGNISPVVRCTGPSWPVEYNPRGLTREACSADRCLPRVRSHEDFSVRGICSPCFLALGLHIPHGDSRLPVYTVTRPSPCPGNISPVVRCTGPWPAATFLALSRTGPSRPGEYDSRAFSHEAYSAGRCLPRALSHEAFSARDI